METTKLEGDGDTTYLFGKFNAVKKLLICIKFK